jgi:type I restriction enzyme, S subunit
MEGWKKYKISDLGIVKTGKTPLTADKGNFGYEYPFITPVDMIGQKYITQTERYLSNKAKEKLKNNLIPKDSICVSCIGSDLGKVVMTTSDSFTNQQINTIIPFNNFDSNFIYYTLKELTPILRNIGRESTAVPIINKTSFSAFEINAPINKNHQTAIASILSSLDDKIELNRKMNQTLEQMSQAIYKRWFIDFEFPDDNGNPYKSSGGEMVESELGMIPKGWKVDEIGNHITLKGGTTPSTNVNEYWNGNIHWTSPRDLSNSNSPFILNTEKRITEAGLAQIGSGLLPIGSVLLSSRAPIGYLVITAIPVAINQGYIGIICDKLLSNYFILNWIRENMGVIKQRANGSTFLEISKTNFRTIKTIIPNKENVQEFSLKVKAIYSLILSNEKEKFSLIELRDSILPKLMSGQLTIKQAEQLV